MRIYNKDETILDKEELKREILNGAVFIYPTDTIYGIGCDATNVEAVKRLRSIKKRHTMPFSVIAPSKEWIKEVSDCDNEEEFDKWIGKLPGPYTLILSLNTKECVAPETNNDLDTLGVRIPDHWFTKIVTEIGVPIITTSANFIGEDFMTSLEDLNPEIKRKVDFIIYEGEKKGTPSNLVFLKKGQTKIQER
ncbi:threonylcarbamoyl-AMP synthase [Candidatus Woesearchaeota archaeon]|nr:threonylcarbamoyl-AMP synthase [Candidatus Woesearchaeota archaeon]